jgi:hypothetical protein
VCGGHSKSVGSECLERKRGTGGSIRGCHHDGIDFSTRLGFYHTSPNSGERQNQSRNQKNQLDSALRVGGRTQLGTVFDLRRTTSQKRKAVPRRARN